MQWFCFFDEILIEEIMKIVLSKWRNICINWEDYCIRADSLNSFINLTALV